VIMALVTTGITTPALKLVLPEEYRRMYYGTTNRKESTPNES
jgi:hypothetical protein